MMMSINERCHNDRLPHNPVLRWNGRDIDSVRVASGMVQMDDGEQQTDACEGDGIVDLTVVFGGTDEDMAEPISDEEWARLCECTIFANN